jgi:hypothetical protein
MAITPSSARPHHEDENVAGGRAEGPEPNATRPWVCEAMLADLAKDFDDPHDGDIASNFVLKNSGERGRFRARRVVHGGG